MIIEQKELQPKMNQLMYNIETKLSLLSEIQKAAKQNHQALKHLPQQFEQGPSFDEIDLPMQMLDKKMHQIIYQKSPSSQKRTSNHQNIKTFDKKRLQLNQLETGTRNIDQIKTNPSKDILNPHQRKPQHHQVREFTHQSQHSMSSSMLDSGSKSSSRILTKFNQIQLNYMEKIKSLTFKLSFLEQKLNQSEQEKQSLMESLETYKLLYSRKQEEIEKEIENRLEEIKEKLIEKFAEQCRLKYNEYITQLKESNSQLNEQRKKRKFYEQQNKVFRLEKQNYEQMYKALAKKQKEWLKIDIDHTKNQLLTNNSHLDLSAKVSYLPEGSSYLVVDNRRQYEHKQVEEYSQIQQLTNCDDTQFINKENVIYNTKDPNYSQREEQRQKTKFSIQKSNQSISKSKEKSLSKSKDHSLSIHKKSPVSQKKKPAKSKTQTQNEAPKQSAVKKTNKHKGNAFSSQMTKQQLIPFLAKGIQQLKERLKMK